MAPKAHSLSQLFHPKKKAQPKQYSGVNGQPKNFSKQGSPQKTQSPAASASTTQTSAQADDDDDTFKLPNTSYSEFRILSSAMQGWKYDVMKFDSRKSVDLNQWQRPIKLNRKDLRRDDPASATPAQPQAVGPMLGPDGKPVIGVDGRVVMVDAEGKPIHSGETGYGGGGGGGASGSASSSKDKGKGNAAPGRKRFQKKTRQVFLVPDEVRQLRKEERYPWVMEDASPEKGELWVGHLEEVAKAETHALFMPAVNDSFKFIPPHRWYKFQKKVKHDLPTDTANVESMYTRSQKKDPQSWLASLHGGRGASAATAALFKQEAEGKHPVSEGQSLGPGGRKLKTVDSGSNDLFGDDEDGSRREKDLGGEGDMDEQVYEEEFADDEEQMNVDDNDEEAKEIEERLKREYQRANKQNETGVDEDDEDDDTPKSRQAKALEKMIRDREGNNAYESDEDKNPYASSEEEEEEEPEPVHTGPAIQQQPQQVDPNKPATPKPPTSTPQTATNSRANSPASPSLGGHSLMAKRATSPKAPKAKISGSRGASPAGSRANSPNPASRATSPLATPSASAGEFKNNKRKADDSPTSPVNGTGPNDVPKPKKKKIQNAPDYASCSASELEALLIEWLKNTPTATTKNCVQHFNSYMLGPNGAERRKEFSSLVKRVATLKDAVLTLRPGLG
ncbi:hypothetical protein H1R20_g5376, partial [Candolleomyces eurysporus]